MDLKYSKPWVRVSAVILCLVIISGCAAKNRLEPTPNSAQPVPTVAAIFNAERPTPVPLPAAPATNRPLAPPRSSGETENSGRDDATTTITDYDDRLNANWSLEHTIGMQVNPGSNTYVDQGNTALAVTPDEEGELLFTVRQGSRQIYKRDQVLAISFRLSGGSNYIDNDALTVALEGSNISPYWIANDSSVQLEGRVTADGPVFSETRLYYLDINRAIPPDTWVDVIVWLDDLIYDPDYTYVTGFHIRNDESFRDTFYIDQVKMIMTE